MVLTGTGTGGAADLEAELEASLLDLVGEAAPASDSARPHTIDELAARVGSFHRRVGILARFEHRGERRLVYGSSDVAFSGSIRVPLRVLRRASSPASR